MSITIKITKTLVMPLLCNFRAFELNGVPPRARSKAQSGGRLFLAWPLSMSARPGTSKWFIFFTPVVKPHHPGLSGYRDMTRDWAVHCETVSAVSDDQCSEIAPGPGTSPEGATGSPRQTTVSPSTVHRPARGDHTLVRGAQRVNDHHQTSGRSAQVTEVSLACMLSRLGSGHSTGHHCLWSVKPLKSPCAVRLWDLREQCVIQMWPECTIPYYEECAKSAFAASAAIGAPEFLSCSAHVRSGANDRRVITETCAVSAWLTSDPKHCMAGRDGGTSQTGDLRSEFSPYVTSLGLFGLDTGAFRHSIHHHPSMSRQFGPLKFDTSGASYRVARQYTTCFMSLTVTGWTHIAIFRWSNWGTFGLTFCGRERLTRMPWLY
ncbi:hypothetical protein RRG08_035740 [Elysia crispata]|uniref:Uncharacterized protein n=1 Tax=Elysia crispata TaxID=231223 RepID=A0AAE0YII4_9GAST|nr:hypothetical protein RRG08_035740 [Elysia crispata]